LESEKRLLKAVENAKKLKPIVKDLKWTHGKEPVIELVEEYEPSYEKKFNDKEKPNVTIDQLTDEISVFDDNNIEVKPGITSKPIIEKEEKKVIDLIPLEIESTNISDEDPIKEYTICKELSIPITGQIHEKNTPELASVVIHIVDIEGPVHISEVVRRIRVAWGIKRAGKRIQDAILNSVSFAQENGDIFIKKEFLYSKNPEIIVRRRSGDPPAKIKLICDEEIAEAAKIVIRTQFASPMPEIVRQTSRLFGIKVTRGATAKRIEEVVQKLVDDGELEIQSNNMINFPKS
jgi:hypothetical protein